WKDEFIDRYVKRYEYEDIELLSVSFEKVVHQPRYGY
ncbi:unnamed protein product, partial [marine sediment metagenome]